MRAAVLSPHNVSAEFRSERCDVIAGASDAGYCAAAEGCVSNQTVRSAVMAADLPKLRRFHSS
jgi:hypothetical protein